MTALRPGSRRRSLAAAIGAGLLSLAAAWPAWAGNGLEHWMQIGRARPEDAAPVLRALIAQQAGDPASLADARLALGEMEVALADEGELARNIAQLRQLGQPATTHPGPEAALARSCADALQALQAHLHGPVGRAERLLDDALARLPAATPDRVRLRLLAWHADLLERASKFEAGTRRFQAAIQLADTMPAPAWRRAELRAGLAKTLYLAGEVQRARELNRQALELARESGDERTLSYVFKTEGVVRSDDSLNESSEAAEAATREAIAHALRAGARRDEIRATANLADMALRRSDYPLALSQSERAISLAQDLHDRNALSVALANAGFARIMLGQLQRGLTLVRASMDSDRRAGELAEVASTQGELGHYLEKAGHLAEAYAAIREYRRLSEQVFRSDLQRNLGELQEAFDHERRARELALLEREGRFQQAQLTSRQLTQWLWTAGALAGGTIMALGALLLRRWRAGNRELVRANRRLAELSDRDTLTGLLNRRGCAARLQRHWPKAGTLVLLDLDHFKQINDRYGHAAGDAVLVDVASRLRGALRDADLVARWGGEEFLLWLDGVTRHEDDALIERILASVAAVPVASGEARIAVTASIGYATLPLGPGQRPPDWQRTVDLVDAAMYVAKSEGRNRACAVRRFDGGPAGAPLGDLRAWHGRGQAELETVAGPAAAAS